jgi:aminoglycoside 3-N-acetyltransferase
MYRLPCNRLPIREPVLKLMLALLTLTSLQVEDPSEPVAMAHSSGEDIRLLSEKVSAVRAGVAALLPESLKALVKSALRSRRLRWFHAVRERRADRRYGIGKRVTSPAEVRSALRSLPLPQDTVVLIHSSMSRLGFVEGGATAVVDALCDVIVGERKSTVAVPTFSMTGLMADTLRAGDVFDVRETPSGTGRISELARRRPDARRSLHPTHSVAAIGPRASWLVDGHHRDTHTFGRFSPFGRLLEADGFVLGLGIDLGPVTFYHVLEDLGAFPVNVYTSDSPIAATCVDERGGRVGLKVMAHDPLASVTRIDKPNGAAIRSYMTTVFENAAGLAWHNIGDGRMWLISARRLYECLDRLKDRGITIYATAEEVERFPSPTSVLVD